MKVGVLALQGAFREHKKMLLALGAEVSEVRLPQQLDDLAAIVIPGGESTTMVRLMARYGFEDALKAFGERGGGIWGTCAGAILLAKKVAQNPEQPSLALLDIEVARNDYGRQVASFEAAIDLRGQQTPFPALFIRAPRITAVGPGVEVIARYQGDPVFVQQGKVMATVFHPELTADTRLHEYFLARVAKQAAGFTRAS